ncbi:MAG: hypothetical protein ACI8R4_000437 [Paracoccaceae bacterium]|jgi:hypothetical protein
MHVIVHAGFHKTGTTTIQKALRQNHAALEPYVKIILRSDMVAVCETARAYSASADVLDLSLFQYELSQLAEGWDASDTRPVLLDSEDLGGHMPGRRGLTSYAATPLLMRTLVETLCKIRPDARAQFFFSTRSADPWLASCYAQHLRATRITQSVEEYTHAYRDSARLAEIIGQIATAVAPHPVHHCALESSQTRPLGPLDPVLDLIGLPDAVRARLVAHPRVNTAPSPAKCDRLLALNRSDLGAKVWRAAKRALLSPKT